MLCDLGYVHHEIPHKTYDQYMAEIYGIKLSIQEARSRMNKIANLTESKTKIQRGIDKSLDRI